MILGLDPERPLSLYIHVPFCSKKCDYCAFYSEPGMGGEVIDEWMRRILTELDELNREWRKPYETIFIGGGNPGLLGTDRIGTLLEKASFNGWSRECTVESNPENLSEDFRTLYGLLTRISVGIQSLDRDVLQTLGRNSSLESNLQALSLLRSLPFDFNCDIITAVPGESVDTALSDIRKVASYNPDHISYYCLSIEEGTPLSRRASPIGGDCEAEFLEKGWALLSSLGYEHYEISNFAKKGRRCLHNMVYWGLGQYIGLGPGAESSYGYRQVYSARENETLKSYLDHPGRTAVPLEKEEAEEEYLLTALRTADGIDKEEYSRRFSVSFSSQYQKHLERLRPSWYKDSPASFSLTEEGFLFLDRAVLELSMGIQ